jgi:hypothetical protein
MRACVGRQPELDETDTFRPPAHGCRRKGACWARAADDPGEKRRPVRVMARAQVALSARITRKKCKCGQLGRLVAENNVRAVVATVFSSPDPSHTHDVDTNAGLHAYQHARCSIYSTEFILKP